MDKKYFRLIFTIGVLSFYMLLCSFTPAADTIKNAGFKLKTIIIDAGHGGKDAGAKAFRRSRKM
jgi:N-acetylmuramoyl-L-alanine amidase